jgi:hypothetical protein
MLEEELGKEGQKSSRLMVSNNHSAKASHFENQRKELSDVKRQNAKLENDIR